MCLNSCFIDKRNNHQSSNFLTEKNCQNRLFFINFVHNVSLKLIKSRRKWYWCNQNAKCYFFSQYFDINISRFSIAPNIYSSLFQLCTIKSCCPQSLYFIFCIVFVHRFMVSCQKMLIFLILRSQYLTFVINHHILIALPTITIAIVSLFVARKGVSKKLR